MQRFCSQIKFLDVFFITSSTKFLRNPLPKDKSRIPTGHWWVPSLLQIHSARGWSCIEVNFMLLIHKPFLCGHIYWSKKEKCGGKTLLGLELCKILQRCLLQRSVNSSYSSPSSPQSLQAAISPATTRTVVGSCRGMAKPSLGELVESPAGAISCISSEGACLTARTTPGSPSQACSGVLKENSPWPTSKPRPQLLLLSHQFKASYYAS